jgi:hypothetical protein
MTGLAAWRRDQGLTASVIHIGLVTDVGYVTRQDRSIQDHLSSLLFLPLSETDSPRSQTSHEEIRSMVVGLTRVSNNGSKGGEEDKKVQAVICENVMQVTQQWFCPTNCSLIWILKASIMR